MEVLTPGHYPRWDTTMMQPTTTYQHLGVNNDEMIDDDEIAVTPNVDYPHSKHRCSVHPFCILTQDRALALDGHRLMAGHNNQPKVGGCGRGDDRVEARWAASEGGTLSYCLGGIKLSDKKIIE